MPVDATAETFPTLVGRGNVLVDFWGPRCQPCIGLMPAVEALEVRYAGRLRVVKVNASENRQLCRNLRVIGLPTYLFFREDTEVERLVGDPTEADIATAVATLVEGGE